MALTVREVALRTPVAVLPETPIADAEQMLISCTASEIYVTDHDDRILGMIPDQEILKYRLLGGDGQGRVAALMTPVTRYLTPAASLIEGARLLSEIPHSSVPVLDGERLIGQLCRSNLLRILSEQQIEPSMDAHPVPGAYLPTPKFLQIRMGVGTSGKFTR
ncbi:CBS domain-containing protein [Planctomicrobium sp. SH661]|uniref:CBS domain-containing protein n=1 Tax=Planctomicrobium sp. SH661 TaxID=3448124 RepID=UPI003F5C3921